MKRKRVGAGQRGSSNPFLSAKDLLSPSMLSALSNKETKSGQFFADHPESDMKEIREGITSTNTEAASSIPSSIKVRSHAVSASLSSPTKGGRALSKKQQKLAEAAKSSRNISQYFEKKQTLEESHDEAEIPCEADSTLSYSSTLMSQEDIIQEEYLPAAVEAAGSTPELLQNEDMSLVEPTTYIVINDDEKEKEEDILDPDHHTSPQDMTSITE